MRLSFAFLAAIAAALTASAGPIYSVQLLPTQTSDGLYIDVLTGINDSGQAVGAGQYISSPGVEYAVVVSASGAALAVVPAGWTNTTAMDINNSGQIAGFGNNGSTSQGFLDGSPIPQPAGSSGKAVAINEGGVVAGSLFDPATMTTTQPAIGTSSGLVAVPVSAGISAFATAINNLGLIAGVYFDAGKSGAFFGSASGIVKIPKDPMVQSVTPSALSDSGQVFGYLGTALQTLAFTGDASGVTPFSSSTTSYVGFGVSSTGQVVGVSYPGALGGWIWDSADGFRNLSDLVPSNWNISNATAISENGTILAIGRNMSDPNSTDGYLVLTPQVSATPEPSTSLLLGGSLAGLLAVRRLRR